MPELASPAWLLLLLPLPLLLLLPSRGGMAAERVKRVACAVLRSLALATVVVALAGPLGGAYSRHTDVMFVLDVSSSIGEESVSAGLEFFNRAFVAKEPAARMGLVVFGADAAVEVLMRRSAEPVREFSSYVEGGGTNIEQALEVAIGAFPSAEHRRVVLLSDGLENAGRARAAAAVARSIGVEVLTIPLQQVRTHAEVYVKNIALPARARIHEPYTVQVTLHSSDPANANLVIMRNGTLLRSVDVDLQPGVNVFSLVEQAAEPGLYEFEAIVNSENDGELENNRYQAFVQVRGAPRVLHAVGEPGLGRFLNAALEAQGLVVDEVPGTAVPNSLHALADYDLVILNNVSGFDLSLAKMELLEDYVRDAGGGLINIGGDKSYAAGGYYGTPVERVLPVNMDVKTEVKIPSLAVIFVIDKSGSMASGSRGEEKLGIAKRAALAAIEVLNRLDTVGVLAFDTNQEWAVPPTEVGMRSPIAEKLRALGTGGGTELFPALREAHKEMSRQQAKLKHLIVLSDGLTDSEADFESMARRIAADGITVSTVSLGADADRDLMQRIASLGNGRYHHTDQPQSIPRIFTSETLVISRKLMVEELTRPKVRYPGEMISGFDADSFPPLVGYQRTFPKPAAQVLLGAQEDDPLLVSWRYGLGKSVAFTSDLTAKWGQHWVRWPEFGRFVSQMARWAMRPGGGESLLPTFRWEGTRGEMLVDVLDAEDRFINGLQMQASVMGPERNTRQATLKQIAPGRYRGEFSVSRAGRYYVNLSGSNDQRSVGPLTFGVAVPYSAEYIDSGVDRELLSDVAAATGGRMLSMSNSSLAAINASKPQASVNRWRIWRPFVFAALLLLLLEVALRKIALPASWQASWQRLWQRLWQRSRRQAPGDPAYEELQASIAELRRQHLQALRSGSEYGADDPAVRARLYIAAAKNRAG